MEKSIYKSKILALIIYIIAEALMIIFPDNLYLCGSFFLLGHIILLYPYITSKIEYDFIQYYSWYLVSIFIMFVCNKDTKLSFVIAFSTYLFILTYLAYVTRREYTSFKYCTHLLFISDILLGINVICIHDLHLIPIYGSIFFLGIGILLYDIIKQKELLRYEKM